MANVQGDSTDLESILHKSLIFTVSVQSLKTVMQGETSQGQHCCVRNFPGITLGKGVASDVKRSSD